MKIMKIIHSIEPRDRIYVKGYGFLPFAKNMGTHATKFAKNLTNEFGQKLIDNLSTGDLIGNKTADKIRSVLAKKAAKNDDANIEIKADVNVLT